MNLNQHQFFGFPNVSLHFLDARKADGGAGIII